MLTTSTRTLVLVVWLVASPTALTLLELKVGAAPLWSDDPNFNGKVTFAMQASLPCNRHGSMSEGITARLIEQKMIKFYIELSGFW